MKMGKLLKEAEKAAKHSYSPYSNFSVGAAVLMDSGKVYTGTNIENRSFGLTNCAERSAIFTAISHGEKKIKAVAVYCPNADYPVSPCGACRQVISEFSDNDCKIIFSGAKGKKEETTMGTLFPYDALDELKNN